MASGTEAVPTTAQTVVSGVESTTSDLLALAKTVQGQVVSKARGRRWKWTKARRDALKLVLSGTPIVDVAERVKAHRNTIMGWMKQPEWMAEAQRAISESQVTTKLRRLKMTSIITDKLGVHSLKALEGDSIANVQEANLALRAHLEYVRSERDLFGEGEQQGGQPAGVHIHLGAPGQPQAVGSVNQATSLLSFREFMLKYDPGLAVVAHSPQEAALLLAEKVLQESNLLDIIREEDRAVMHQEDEVSEAAKRRR
jgi:hypothetical protein